MNNTELQKEPINPVTVIKDGKNYLPHEVYKLQTPFKISVGNYSITIRQGMLPIYFKRKQVLVVGSSVKLIGIKYAVGCEVDGIKSYDFFTPDGKKLEGAI